MKIVTLLVITLPEKSGQAKRQRRKCASMGLYELGTLTPHEAVWRAGDGRVGVASGATQLVAVNKLKAGLKELGDDFRKPMAERYDTVNGAGSWNKLMVAYSECMGKPLERIVVLEARHQICIFVLVFGFQCGYCSCLIVVVIN